MSASSAGSDSAFSDDFVRTKGNKKVIKEIAVKKNVQFMTAKADLTPDAKKIIAAVAGALKKRPNTKLTVEGHTFATELHPGASGPKFKVESKEYKELRTRMKKLSLLRAKAVKKELIKKGANKKNVRAVGMGDKRPLMKGDAWDEEGSKRVVFLTNGGGKAKGRYGAAKKGKKATKGAGKGKAAKGKGKAAVGKKSAGKGKAVAVAKASAGKSSSGKKTGAKGSSIMTPKKIVAVARGSGSSGSSASGSDSGVGSSNRSSSAKSSS
jgi:outer membrane protein OmpA-like peptidoglycan-associated protein